jgi:lactoylglutathione lyase
MIESEGETLVRRLLDILYEPSGELVGLDEVLAEDTYDNVSGQRGIAMWQNVGAWMRQTFADAAVEVHQIMSKDDQVMVWMTATVTHIGSGLPRLQGIAPTGNRVTWPQVHIFRVAEGRLAEHWAVRDDYAMVEQIVGAGPLVAPPDH